jgi:hypothetical protein
VLVSVATNPFADGFETGDVSAGSASASPATPRPR